MKLKLRLLVIVPLFISLFSSLTLATTELSFTTDTLPPIAHKSKLKMKLDGRVVTFESLELPEMDLVLNLDPEKFEGFRFCAGTVKNILFKVKDTPKRNFKVFFDGKFAFNGEKGIHVEHPSLFRLRIKVEKAATLTFSEKCKISQKSVLLENYGTIFFEKEAELFSEKERINPLKFSPLDGVHLNYGKIYAKQELYLSGSWYVGVDTEEDEEDMREGGIIESQKKILFPDFNYENPVLAIVRLPDDDIFDEELSAEAAGESGAFKYYNTYCGIEEKNIYSAKDNASGNGVDLWIVDGDRLIIHESKNNADGTMQLGDNQMTKRWIKSYVLKLIQQQIDLEDQIKKLTLYVGVDKDIHDANKAKLKLVLERIKNVTRFLIKEGVNFETEATRKSLKDLQVKRKIDKHKPGPGITDETLDIEFDKYATLSKCSMRGNSTLRLDVPETTYKVPAYCFIRCLDNYQEGHVIGGTTDKEKQTLKKNKKHSKAKPKAKSRNSHGKQKSKKSSGKKNKKK